MISKVSDKVYLTPTMRLSVRTLLKPSKSLSNIVAFVGEEGSFPHTKRAYTSDPPIIDKEKFCLSYKYVTMTMHSRDNNGNNQIIDESFFVSVFI